MERKHIVTIAALLIVLGWSVAMVAIGQESAIVTLAPVLGLTIQQVIQASRARSAPASGHRVEAVPDGEDGAR
ncbi:hypothetical protein [Streptomyces sp. NPDC057939]|uniref:hypothetical protein n=1 Tax=Streptomyces sp. NPDC057939 TaxID=3346284 RepID=UPI0036E74D75